MSKLIKSRMQQHTSTFSVLLKHTITPGGVKGQIFSDYSHVADQMKGNGAYSVLTHTHTQTVSWIKGKINSECDHVAYQIKGNEVKTNIKANTLTLNTPLTSGSGRIQILKLYI